MVRLAVTSLAGLLLLPAFALAHDAELFHVHPLSVIPFGLLLLAIALMPLLAGRFWHSNLNKLLVAGVIALPVLIYLTSFGSPGLHKLAEALLEYAQFIALLASLYTVAGGIVLEGDLLPSVKVNVGLLLLGAVLANLIGTTGASMLLIRPFLKINGLRVRKSHIPIFFIFLVSNLGGLLTPLGDPPLFLGFLRGVSFFWTLGLWKHWLVAIGVVTAVFAVWDWIALKRETPHRMENLPGVGPVRLLGTHNFLFLAIILGVILLMSDDISHALGLPGQLELAARLLGRPTPPETPPLDIATVKAILFIAPLALLSWLSMATTSKQLRKDNDFSWGAILEVAVLFVGIFVTMAPALALLQADDGSLGVKEPWQFFWATGALSSFLDNAPTYVSFASLAANSDTFNALMLEKPLVLQAISAGAVFMGANTYIGNGPNFMVKAIADEAGYDTPSFFGYMLYSGLILLPTFALITVLFFI